MPTEATRALPAAVRLLGWAGVIPFALAPTAAFLRPHLHATALAVFVAYGAVILAFLGGSRWGRAMDGATSWTRYVESVLASLLAFAALLLVHHPHWALVLLGLGFTVWLLLDLRDPLWSPAYKRMRLGISVVVLVLHASWLLL